MPHRRLFSGLLGVVTLATLGCATDTPSATRTASRSTTTTAATLRLPRPASSFGAVVSDGWLYVYGGHVADTHQYSTATISGHFSRLNLSNSSGWQTLPPGPLLQGMNLAAWHGKVLRVGGMTPHNPPGQDADVHSVSDAALYDPATTRWTALPALPRPRSSHDMAVLGDVLYVTGGWTLTGDMFAADFAADTLALDLSATSMRWRSIGQPFKRRALAAAAHDGKLYAIGGFEETGDPSLRVDVYDPKTGTWSRAPDLPGPELNGFGPAACEANGRLYVSVADGSVYVLNAAGDGWAKIGQTPPRIVHRMVADGERLLILGGAQGAKQTDRIDVVNIASGPLGGR